MPNYQATKIYKLVCLNDEIKDIYVGSTVLPLKTRYWKHSSQFIETPDRKVSKFITENGGLYKNWKIELIEDYPCNTKEQKLLREKYWIQQLNPSLNSVSPILLIEDRKKQQHEWYETKRDETTEEEKEKKREINKLQMRVKREKEKLEKEERKKAEMTEEKIEKDKIEKKKKRKETCERYYKNNKEEIQKKRIEKNENMTEEEKEKKREVNKLQMRELRAKKKNKNIIL